MTPLDLLDGLQIEALLWATALMMAFILLLFVGSLVLPGTKIVGPEVDGPARTYKLNGLLLFLISVLGSIALELTGIFPLYRLVENFFAFLIVANVFSLALSGWLYWRGARSVDSSSGFVEGFLMGAEHSPSLFGIDLKLFSYRPSLIALALFNLSFASAQLNELGELTPAMILYQVFTFLYVFNYFQFEYGMVHTWDLVSERFGLMLVWGDYVLVPFFYCISGWWLLSAPVTLPLWAIISLCLLFILGFWLFRGANEQKHRFKRDPNIYIWGKPAEALEGRLLVSGFWGIGRHLNYTGEICVYLAFTMTTGFVSIFPLLLPAWLICLLCHRSLRDERRCSSKYGDLWTGYKERVRFSMLPFIY
ncbi:MAG: DUF1295 domain-containing protein [Bacteroidetes bacterium]|nr:DUF1295 domain-containing protein [Bacteroidota bacterium]